MEELYSVDAQGFRRLSDAVRLQEAAFIIDEMRINSIMRNSTGFQRRLSKESCSKAQRRRLGIRPWWKPGAVQDDLKKKKKKT